MNKIESFKSFSQLQTQLREEAAKKEMAANREASVAEYNELLSKYNVSKITELSEEDRATFMQELGEGNAFGAAVKKAKEEGEDEFEVDGETYKVEEEAEETEEVAVEEAEETEEVAEETEEVAEEAEEEVEESWTVEEGRAFVAAARKAKDAGEEEFEYNGKKYPVLIERTEEVNEAKGNKRQVTAVAKSYSTYASKFPILNDMGDTSFLWMIREVLKAALIDANFHTEAAMVGKYIKPAKLEAIEINPEQLGGKHWIKVPKKTIMDLVDTMAGNVTGAAKYDGYAIIEGTAEYLDTIRAGKISAEGLRAALAALRA